ncbi:hypothetical protein quinque_008902 [Culex quinquefasciatus]
MRVLRSFGISVDKIYTITTDNGSNMLATSKSDQDRPEGVLEELSESDDNDEALEDRPRSFAKTDRDEEIKTVFSAIRCAAHTVQLAVHDTLKSTNMKKHIATLKTFVKGFAEDAV